MEIFKFVQSLLKRKWLIITITLLSAISTFIFISLKPGIYVSTTQLATGITDNQGVFQNDNDVSSSYFAIHNKFSNLIENINSRQVLSLLSYSLILNDLDKKKQPFSQVEDDVHSKYSKQFLEQARLIFKNKLDSILLLSSLNLDEKYLLDLLKDYEYDTESIQERLTVKRIPSTDYILINYASENPLYSAFAVNTLSNEFIRYSILIKGERTDYSVNFFANLVRERKEELESKSSELREFKATNEVLNFSAQSESIIDQIKGLEISEEEEQKKIIGLEQAIFRINSTLTNKELSYLESRAVNINERIYNLKQKISALNEKSLDSNNSSLTNQLNNLRTQLDVEIKNLTRNGSINSNSLKQDLIEEKINKEIELDIAKARLNLISSKVTRLRRNASNFANKEAQISAYEREIAVAQDEYLAAVENLNNARLDSRNDASSIRIIEMGFPADEPIPKGRLLTTAIVTTCVLLLVIIVILLLEVLDLTFKSEEALKTFTGISCIGSLPQNSYLKSKNSNFDFLFTNSKSPKLTLFKENLRKIRYEIEQTNARTFLFSSIKKGEGKSTFIVSLAYSFSLSSRKVLIVDGNLKDNRLTKLFSAKPALDNLSSIESSDFNKLVSGTGYKGIDIIGCRMSSNSPLELFPMEKLNQLIVHFSNKYDLIFIEGANLENYVDSKELIDSVERVIYIFLSENSYSMYDKKLIDYISQKDQKVLGAVLNRLAS